MRKFVFALIVCLMAPGTAAYAAVLNGIEGDVRVNTGSGPRRVIESKIVKPGDTVTVRGQGQALVQFDNGCVASIAANQTVTIPTDPPCAPGATDPTPLILGGLAVAGGVGIIIAVANDDDDSPAVTNDDPPPASP